MTTQVSTYENVYQRTRTQRHKCRGCCRSQVNLKYPCVCVLFGRMRFDCSCSQTESKGCSVSIPPDSTFYHTIHLYSRQPVQTVGIALKQRGSPHAVIHPPRPMPHILPLPLVPFAYAQITD